MPTCEDYGYDTCRNCGNERSGYTGCVPKGTDQSHIVYPSFYINNSTNNVAQNYTSGEGIAISDVTRENVRTLPFVSFPTSQGETLANDIPTARTETTPAAPLLQTILDNPPQVNRDLSLSNFDTLTPNPARVNPSVIPPVTVEAPPVQARQDNTISSPSTSIFNSAKPFVIIGVALFAAASLFLTPKASKRR